MNRRIDTTSTIAAYMADLDTEMAGAEPAVRAEIVASVRDHISQRLDALDHEPTAGDIDSVLADLGDPRSVAATWFEEGPSDAATAAAIGHVDVQRRADAAARTAGWVVLGGAVLALLIAPLPLLGTVAAIAALVASIVVFRSRLRGGPSAALGAIAIALASLAVLFSLATLLGLADWGHGDTTTSSDVSVVEGLG